MLGNMKHRIITIHFFWCQQRPIWMLLSRTNMPRDIAKPTRQRRRRTNLAGSALQPSKVSNRNRAGRESWVHVKPKCSSFNNLISECRVFLSKVRSLRNWATSKQPYKNWKEVRSSLNRISALNIHWWAISSKLKAKSCLKSRLSLLSKWKTQLSSTTKQSNDYLTRGQTWWRKAEWSASTTKLEKMSRILMQGRSLKKKRTDLKSNRSIRVRVISLALGWRNSSCSRLGRCKMSNFAWWKWWSILNSRNRFNNKHHTFNSCQYNNMVYLDSTHHHNIIISSRIWRILTQVRVKAILTKSHKIHAIKDVERNVKDHHQTDPLAHHQTRRNEEETETCQMFEIATKAKRWIPQELHHHPRAIARRAHLPSRHLLPLQMNSSNQASMTVIIEVLAQKRASVRNLLNQ